MDLSQGTSSIFIILFAAAMLHSLFLAFILFTKVKAQTDLRWLGGIMVLLGIWLLEYLFFLTNSIKQQPHLLGLLAPFIFLLPACYHLFLQVGGNAKFQWRWTHIAHLLPALYILVAFWPTYFLDSSSKLAIVERIYQNSHPTLLQMIQAHLLHFLLLAYAGWQYLLLKRWQNKWPEGANRIAWLKRFNWIFGGVVVAMLVLTFLFWSMQWPATILELSMVLLLVVLIHYLSYDVLQVDTAIPAIATTKYKSSSLDKTKLNELSTLLRQHLETKQPWRNTQFDLQQLAKNMQVPRHHLSQVFSEVFSSSFKEVITQHRLAAVEQRLLAGDLNRLSLAGIAEEAGFGSKSNFYRSFKKRHGVTPSTWLQAQKGSRKL